MMTFSLFLRVTKVLGALHELKKPNSRMISRRDAVLRETKKAVSFNAETIEQVQHNLSRPPQDGTPC